MIGELTRLYQAALEEQRRVITHIDAGDGQAHERAEAVTHIAVEVVRAHADLLDAYYGRSAT